MLINHGRFDGHEPRAECNIVGSGCYDCRVSRESTTVFERIPLSQYGLEDEISVLWTAISFLNLFELRDYARIIAYDAKSLARKTTYLVNRSHLCLLSVRTDVSRSCLS